MDQRDEHEFQRLRELHQALDEAAIIVSLEPNGLIRMANGKYLRSLGLGQSEVVGKSFASFLAADYPPTVLAGVLKTVGRGLNWKGEIKQVGKGNHTLWIDASFFPIFDEERRLKAIQILAVDVSERKAVETSLSSNQDFQKILMNMAPVGIFMANAFGECSYVNDQWTEITGRRLRRAVGFRWLEAVHAADRERVAAAWDALVHDGTAMSCEYRYIDMNGEEKWVIANGTRIPAPSGKSRYLRIEQDLTQRKRQEKLLEEQRAQLVSISNLSSLGEMASGIAHEINNPLTIINARASQLRERLSTGYVDFAWAVKTSETIEKTCDRIAKIIQSLRMHARDGSRDGFEEVPLGRILAETTELCHSRFRQGNVRLEINPGQPNLMITCRPVQISQLLLNLLTNAYDAVANEPVRWVRLDVHEGTENIEICVTDSGPGIDGETRERIFQPFFTTKPVGQGMGLGLSLSSKIARDHEGNLELSLDSKPTRFIARLPKRRGDLTRSAA